MEEEKIDSVFVESDFGALSNSLISEHEVTVRLLVSTPSLSQWGSNQHCSVTSPSPGDPGASALQLALLGHSLLRLSSLMLPTPPQELPPQTTYAVQAHCDATENHTGKSALSRLHHRIHPQT